MKFKYAAMVLAVFPMVGCATPNKENGVMQGYYDPTVEEINTVSGLNFDGNRLVELRRIATRTNLIPPEQVHLVNVSMKKLDFDNSKMDVLLTLINNPAFSMEAKNAIMFYVPKFGFDSDRLTLMRAMEGKPAMVMQGPGAGGVPVPNPPAGTQGTGG